MGNRKTIEFDKNKLYVQIACYENNNRIYIGLNTKDDYYCDLTINLDREIISEEYVYIDSLATEIGLVDVMKEKGLIKDVIGTINYNMGEYQYAKIDIEKLKEFDEQGYTEYLKSIEKNDIEIEM